MNCNHEKNGYLAFSWGLNNLIPAGFVFDLVHTLLGNINETEYMYSWWETIWATFNLSWIFLFYIYIYIYICLFPPPILSNVISESIVLTLALYSGGRRFISQHKSGLSWLRFSLLFSSSCLLHSVPWLLASTAYPPCLSFWCYMVWYWPYYWINHPITPWAAGSW